MTAAARFKQGEITKALRAARQAGYATVRVRIDQEGRLEVIASNLPADVAKEDWRSSQPLYRGQH